VPGLEERDPSLLGVVISHPHLDHYGLSAGMHDSVPVVMGGSPSNHQIGNVVSEDQHTKLELFAGLQHAGLVDGQNNSGSR
jgi:mRNA degradation ribonuclease J1/J2